MADKMEDTRQLITKQLRVFRMLQTFQADDKKITTNEIAVKVNIPWASANKVLEDFIAHKVVDKDYKINPSVAYFMGISLSHNMFNISVVGLDGKCLDLKQVCNELNIFPKCLDNYKFEYSFLGLSKLSKHIKDFIYDLKPVYPIKAVCFSFDDADLGNKTFTTTNYLETSHTNSYPFDKACDLWFKDLQDDIMFFLDCNSACYAFLKEFPCLKQKGNKIYLYLAKTGCFITPIIDKKIHYGSKFSALNLTSLIDEKEKKVLLSKNPNTDKVSQILEKLLTPFVISIAPDYFSIDINLLSDKLEGLHGYFDMVPFLYCNLFKTCYCPDYNIDTFSNISIGTAISAMYQYYGWDLEFI